MSSVVEHALYMVVADLASSTFGRHQGSKETPLGGSFTDRGGLEVIHRAGWNLVSEMTQMSTKQTLSINF